LFSTRRPASPFLRKLIHPRRITLSPRVERFGARLLTPTSVANPWSWTENSLVNRASGRLLLEGPRTGRSIQSLSPKYSGRADTSWGRERSGACSRQDRTPSTARVQRSRWSTIGVGDILQGDVELKEEIHRRPAAAVGLDTFTVKNMIGARTFVIHVYFLRRSNVTESPPDCAPGSSPSADRSATPVGNLEMLARRSFATPVSRSRVRVSSSPPAPTRTAQLEHNRR
jgi:hypothetical protein